MLNELGLNYFVGSTNWSTLTVSMISHNELVLGQGISKALANASPVALS